MKIASKQHIDPVVQPVPFDGQVHGTSAGGDTDELRLLSTNQTYIHVLGYGGSLDFVSTKVRLVVSRSRVPGLSPDNAVDSQHLASRGRASHTTTKSGV